MFTLFSDKLSRINKRNKMTRNFIKKITVHVVVT